MEKKYSRSNDLVRHAYKEALTGFVMKIGIIIFICLLFDLGHWYFYATWAFISYSISLYVNLFSMRMDAMQDEMEEFIENKLSNN